jgi:uncharacterized protein YdhG (YjbR/CyaY superfamily)
MTVDDYLTGAPEPHRSTLGAIRAALRSVLPDAVETLSYGVPAVKVAGKTVAGYAFFKNHCSYFPHSGSVLEELADQLTGFEWSKGTLTFPVDQPLPESLVRRLVEVRLRQLGLTS